MAYDVASMGVPLNVNEWMKGYVGIGATDFAAGFAQGLAQATYLEYEVRISIDDIDRFVAEPAHVAAMTGHISCDAFGGVCPLLPSTFNMFVDGADPKLKYMFYRMPFETHDGRAFTLLGTKTLHDDKGFDLWSDITTLDVRIFAGGTVGIDLATPAPGPVPVDAPPIAVGILHVQSLDNIRAAMSFRTPAGLLHLPGAVKKFCAFYGRSLWDVYVRHHPAAKT